MKMPDGYKTGPKHLFYFLLILLCLSSGCSDDSAGKESTGTDYCPKKYGCLNDEFIKLFEDKCVGKENRCRFSFKELFGEVDKVYFTHQLMLWFDECSTFPISDTLKKTNTEACRYILFENDNKITSYLRSSCLSDLKINEKNVISFDTTIAGMIAVMNADEVVLMSKEDQGDKVYYFISPEKSQVSEFKGDDCIHSP
jgi:hypothetical protein